MKPQPLLDLPRLPDKWQYSPLGELVDQARGICYGIVQPGSAVNDGVPVVRVNNIRGGRIATDDVLTIHPEIEAKYRRSRLRGGEVLLTLVGSLGESAIVSKELTDWNVARAVGVVPVSDVIGSRWVELCLRSPLLQRYIRVWATTTVQATFNLRDVARLPIPLPPARERQAIAHILGTLDDKIELNRRRNRTLEGLARALFQSWFVDFDPVHAKAAGQPPPGLSPELAALFPDSFEESELGLIPKGWRVGTVGDVACEVRDAVDPSEIDPETPYIALEHMPKRCLSLDDWGKADGIASGKLRFSQDDILFGKLRPYFHKVGPAPIDGVCSTDIVVAKPVAETWYGLVLGHLSSVAFVAHTDRGSTGTKMPRTNWRDMSRYAITIPNELVATRFTRLVRGTTGQMHTLTHESRTLAALRDALLPKLISGELRVPDAERIVA